jgi:PKD repeat protein
MSHSTARLVALAALLVACNEPLRPPDPEPPHNVQPVADFIVSCVNLTCSFTDRSTDSGGSVVSRAWNFGDGQTSAELNPTHTYVLPGGQFRVTLTVTDNEGAVATVARDVHAVQSPPPDRSGTYERETPHATSGRHTRYVIRSDNTFELRDATGGGTDTTIYTGRWTFACCWMGWAIEPGSVMIFDFDDVVDDTGICGESYGVFLTDDQLGISYCGVLLRAGLEEGVYASAPVTTPGPPPPQSGEIAFVYQQRIYLASTAGDLRQLSAGPNDFDPAWSPDGRRIAFARTNGDSSGIFVMDSDGLNLVRRATGGSDPTWSEDGKSLAYSCWNGAQAGLCTVNVDDTATPDTLRQEPGFIAYPAWSPDGTRIAYTSDWGWFDFWFDIWVTSPDGSQRTALTTHTPASPNPYAHYQPAWSPDGQRIAFVSCPWAYYQCSSSAVSVMNADGSNLFRITATSGFASPTWSRDGQVIAFQSPHGIEWVSADGSARGRLVGEGHSPAWRPEP